MKPTPLGAPHSVSEEDEKLQKAVAFSLSNKRLSQPVTKVTNTKVQVVAGYNYFFDLHFENGDRFSVVVYEDLSGKMIVTKFESKK